MTTPIESTSESTPMTDPPRRPTDQDTTLLGFAQSVELAARDLYRLAVEAGAGGEQIASIAAIAAHHDAYAQAISGLIGTEAPQVRDEAVFSSLQAAFDTSADSMARAAHDLENLLVATHQSLLASLSGIEGSALIASILIVEARHSAAMASLAGLSPTRNADAFFTTPAVQPLSPTANL